MKTMQSKAGAPRVALTKTTLKNLTVSTGLKTGLAREESDSCSGCSLGCSCGESASNVNTTTDIPRLQ